MIPFKNEKKEVTISFTKKIKKKKKSQLYRLDKIIISILRVFYRQVHLFLTLKQRNYLHSFFLTLTEVHMRSDLKIIKW